ncbi:hypothetical protein BGX30_009926 [Mortierella sp. GBA39]|nr:hypothetical protein BGX30_009926 [Mortierella sp. GBA39]
MDKKQEYKSSQEEQIETENYGLESAKKGDTLSLKESDPENSTIEAVRLVVPLTDDPTFVALTFRFQDPSSQKHHHRWAQHVPQPGPFNIKEHALIGIAVSAASITAYAIDILTAMDLFVKHRMGALAGVLRKYLVSPAEMVWWGKLVHVVFYNAIHNTDEFKMKMVRGWSYMKFFRVDFWAMFSSMAGGGVGIMSLSFDWTIIGGYTLWLPVTTQLNQFSGIFLSYWVIVPTIRMKNILSARTFGRPLTPSLFHSDGEPFDITPYLNDDFSLNDDKYNASAPVTMTPMYALAFMYYFIARTGCITHILCFHGADIWRTWKQSCNSVDEDIHVRMVKDYPEVLQIWYAAFYIVMIGLSCMVCEVYGLQLPYWGLLFGLAMGWILSFPMCAMTVIAGAGPGVNVISELVCGFMFPRKPLANMTFKCYAYMAAWQCKELLSDLKLGVYMKIPPRSMFAAQLWGTVIGGMFNYVTMTLIINAKREYLDGTTNDPNGLWTGLGAQIMWGSALIYGALGPHRMFSPKGNYHSIYWGFFIGTIIPIIQWELSKKFPKIKWSLFNITVFAGGMSAFPEG